ncbi:MULTISPECIES: hypothetical protein [Moorena]|uniref:hypothetical protein n=1 Tax=Moorena TaxID=1155738 RepID=UPI0013B8F489|nr:MULTISPECIES: hypothetical protein [Moorena]NEQ17172.1 hypothetical protein [Moorena sp. SIO3E2]NEP34703.1 hypothetical protein [Moorena sp. SIO3B2]NEQ09410.1 hypothetical protein [Moorena sp. SIO4E2]NER86644.1 hypothetical protein [Moorena sp. SIO3A2]NES46135.1 hypothetical protein [Moorena sp. SIO2C4]
MIKWCFKDYLPTLRLTADHSCSAIADLVGWANGHDNGSNGVSKIICPPYA